MVVLEPIGGLANRMRAIATALSVCRSTGTKLNIVWNENEELNCPFGLLFEPISDLSIIKKRFLYNFIGKRGQGGLKSAIKANVVNTLLGFSDVLTEQDHPFNITAQLEANKNLYIKTCQRFNDDKQYYKLFRPVPAIQQKIENLSSLFNEDTIGVQIRRTDNTDSIMHSPLELFICKMNELLAQRPKVSFFLTTDDITIEQELRHLFPGKIMSHPKELSRNTPTGIQDAVADLFTLSETSLILGSHWSSFSEVAALLGGKQLLIIKNKD